MALFTWSSSFSVGVTQFDKDHQTLIGMVNDLHDAMKSGKGNEVLKGLVDRLSTYTQTHFAAEERLMQGHGYPKLAEHRKHHQDLIQEVVELRKKMQEGKPVLTMQVMNFLRDWLMTHIQKEDKGYGPYLNSKGVS